MRRGTWIVSFAILVACTFGVVSLASAGDESEALWNETLSMLRRYDVKTGKNRPELSYRPTKEEPAKE
jgi:hypothetical protein